MHSGGRRRASRLSTGRCWTEDGRQDGGAVFCGSWSNWPRPPLPPCPSLSVSMKLFLTVWNVKVYVCVVADITPMFTEIKITLNSSQAAVHGARKEVRRCVVAQDVTSAATESWDRNVRWNWCPQIRRKEMKAETRENLVDIWRGLNSVHISSAAGIAGSPGGKRLHGKSQTVSSMQSSTEPAGSSRARKTLGCFLFIYFFIGGVFIHTLIYRVNNNVPVYWHFAVFAPETKLKFKRYKTCTLHWFFDVFFLYVKKNRTRSGICFLSLGVFSSFWQKNSTFVYTVHARTHTHRLKLKTHNFPACCSSDS